MRAISTEYILLRKDQRDLRRFVEESVTVGTQLSVPRSELYEEYKKWCEANGKFIREQTWVTRNINQMYPGVVGTYRYNNVLRFRGIDMSWKYPDQRDNNVEEQTGTDV